MSQEALKTALQETCAQRDTFKEHAEALTQEVLRLREQLGSHVAHTREAEPADRLRAVDLARGDLLVSAGLRRQLPGQLRRSPSWDRTSIRSPR